MRPLLLPIAFCFCLQLSAQVQQGHFLNFGFNFTHQTVKDESLSPVSYSGPLGGLGIGYFDQNDKWLSQFEATITGAYQYPDIERDLDLSQTTTILSRAYYSLQYEVLEKDEWHYFAGLKSHNLFDFRDHNRYTNSQSNYFASFSLGPIITVQRGFGYFSKRFQLQSGFAFPVATYQLRPGYVKPFTNSEVGDQGFAYWGDFYMLDWRSELAWLLPNGNQIELSYHWNYTELQQLNKIQLAAHQIALNVIVAL